MTITKITDHAARAVAQMQGWAREKARIPALTEILADEVQLLEDVLWQVLTNSRLANATGDILDEYGGIFDELRGNLSDGDYAQVLEIIIAAHQSDATAKEIIAIASTLIGKAVRYTVFSLAHYRLEYETDAPVVDDWRARVIRVLEILRPVGVSYTLHEGDDAGVFRFNSGPGFNQGRLATRITP